MRDSLPLASIAALLAVQSVDAAFLPHAAAHSSITDNHQHQPKYNSHGSRGAFLALSSSSKITETLMNTATTKQQLEASLRKLRVSTDVSSRPPPQVHILSRDPLVYEIPNLLSKAECEAYQRYVISQEHTRPMTRSNPPDVSLDVSKLWPLPFLSLLAGVPPYIRLLQQQQQQGGHDNMAAALHHLPLSLSSIAQAVVPNILLALSAMAALAWGVVVPLLRQQSNQSARTSVAVALNQEKDTDLVRPLVERVVAATPNNHPWWCWEAPVVTRYDPGAVFARHGDASPTRGSEWKDAGGQRVVTCICYLNDVTAGGGETYFDQLDLAVQPAAGKALFFFPADRETWKADDRTTHESIAPVATDKWIVQMFGRAERVPPPLGLPDSFANDDG